MKERPILFSGSMVRAILEGRKKQTRRVVKPQPIKQHHLAWLMDCGTGGFHVLTNHASTVATISCPYGVPGDRLWVRETLRIHPGPDHAWHYAADGGLVWLPYGHPQGNAMVGWASHKENDVCVSIHMPRWASRITLEVTGVRVERLQDISEKDAKAEGAPIGFRPGVGPGRHSHGFRDIWFSINGSESWDANPWVWVVEFKRIEAKSEAA